MNLRYLGQEKSRLIAQRTEKTRQKSGLDVLKEKSLGKFQGFLVGAEGVEPPTLCL